MPSLPFHSLLRGQLRNAGWLLAAICLTAMTAARGADDHGHDHGHSHGGAGHERMEFKPEGARPGSAALTIPLFLANNHVVLPATLTNTRGDREHITLELSLEHPGTIVLHADQMNWLDIPRRGAESTETEIGISLGEENALVFPVSDIATEADRRLTREQMQLTVDFATDLQERKLKGRLGLGFLRRFNVEVDVPQRQLRLTPRDDSAAPVAGQYTAQFDFSHGAIALPLAGEKPAHLLVGSTTPESRVSPEHARAHAASPAGFPALPLDSVPGLDLASAIAFREMELAAPPTPSGSRPVAVTGVDLLSVYTLKIDWHSGTLALDQQRPAVPSEGNRSFYAAEKINTPEAYIAFLEQHADNHFAREAAQRLMTARLEEWGASDDDILAALKWIIATALPQRSVESGFPVVQQLADMPGRSELAIAAGNVVLAHSRDTLRIQDLYRLHRVLGAAHLENGDLHSAWRHLMSATFVKIDQDGEHAFLGPYFLGRVYEAQGRAGRAYSRYRAALRAPLFRYSPPKEMTDYAKSAIERLRGTLPADQLKLLDQQ